MLAPLFGSLNKERVLIYLTARGRGYAREIARTFDTALYPVQNALDRLEAAGVLVSRLVGLGDERPRLVQMLFDLGLQFGRRHRPSQGSLVIHLPRMIHLMFRFVDRSHMLLVWVIS